MEKTDLPRTDRTDAERALDAVASNTRLTLDAALGIARLAHQARERRLRAQLAESAARPS
jgi:hypothetical protein